MVATMVQADGRGDYDTGQPVPTGWRMSQDPSSSTGRLLFTNQLSGKAQYEWPSAPAQPAAPVCGGAKAAGNANERSSSTSSRVSTTEHAIKKKKHPGVEEPAASVLTVGSTSKDRARRETAAARAAEIEAAAKVAAEKDHAAAAKATAERTARVAAETKAEETEAKKATLRLAAASQKADATAEGGLRHTTVAALLKKLELTHYADKFASAGVDDEALANLVDHIEDSIDGGGGSSDDDSDGAGGQSLLETMIAKVGARGGAAVKLRKAFVKGGPKPGGAGAGAGRGGGRGGGRGAGAGGRGRGRGTKAGGGRSTGSGVPSNGRPAKKEPKPAKGKKKKK